jgi:hypothetical protein
MGNKLAKGIVRAGRATVFVAGLAVVLALVLGVATTALAGTGVGATFNLGKVNSVGALSTLVGTTASSMLKVDNNGAGTALDLQVGPSTTPPADKAAAPMTVDSQAKVANLNADELDGKDASAFANAAHPHSGADISSGTVAEARIDPSLARDGEVVNTVKANDGAGSALDADLLDGRDSSAFGIKTAHNLSYTDDCDTPNVWNECGKVQVTVPVGKTYLVSVWSSFTARGGASNQDVEFCSAMRGPNAASPSCITPWGWSSKVGLEANQLRGATSSGETVPLSEGTYTFSTAINPTAQFSTEDFGRTITKVMVRDASGATVSAATLKGTDIPKPDRGR